jgi:glutathione S-transferase
VLRVHRIPFSTNVERVALAAGHKGVEVEWVDHDPADRSDVLELSGQELVPVAEFDGQVVRGSMRIVERLEELVAEPPLVPADPAAASWARIFVSWFDRVWKGPPNALDVADEPPDADALRARAGEWTGWCSDLLGSSPYLGGEALGLADVCAFPFLKYAVVDPLAGDEERFHHILVELLREDVSPALAEWIARVDALSRA